MRLALVACSESTTADALAAARTPLPAWESMTPARALAELRAGDGALGRLDVVPALDGMEEGLYALGVLAARGVHVLNDPAALLAAHDKLLTARLLRRHGLPHPRTHHVREGRPLAVVLGPVVVKPRFGSWGREVYRCDDRASLLARLDEIRDAPWFRRHGALVQELVSPQGYDLRVVVAAGRVVGAVHRVAAEGEWRTNVALGGVRLPVAGPPREAALLAREAARATGAMLVGVDLLPDGRGGWTILELNGAVEFTREYSPSGDIFAETSFLLAWAARDGLVRRAALAV